MDTLEKYYPRYLRPLALLLGLAVYVAFTWGLFENGFMRASQTSYLQMVFLWVAGLGALTLLPQRWHYGLDEQAVILLRALWCNLGVVAMAVLVPHYVRVLMLVIPIFGVFYAGLHLNRSHVVLVAILTWLFYVLASGGLATYDAVDQQFESLVGVAFACMLGGALLLSWEATRIRDRLTDANSGLHVAMSRLQHLAQRDELTELLNRRAILEILDRQKSLADRDHESFTVCYCDLDHFKQVNDQFGHSVGDKALCQFAALASAVVRNIDYVARIGGEEFLMVLVGAEEDAARNVSERLKRRTRTMWVQGTDDDFSLTVSIGVTRYLPGERVEDVLNRADRALYQAKQVGRDRVIVAD